MSVNLYMDVHVKRDRFRRSRLLTCCMSPSVKRFLLHQANAGKWIIVETHSDLIVRRIIREIVEEKIAIGQQKICIYFADIDNASDGFHYSTIQPIAVDEETGRIANWPSGFLDDDLKESRRLFEIMYGALPSAEIDDEAAE